MITAEHLFLCLLTPQMHRISVKVYALWLCGMQSVQYQAIDASVPPSPNLNIYPNDFSAPNADALTW